MLTIFKCYLNATSEKEDVLAVPYADEIIASTQQSLSGWTNTEALGHAQDISQCEHIPCLITRTIEPLQIPTREANRILFPTSFPLTMAQSD